MTNTTAMILSISTYSVIFWIMLVIVAILVYATAFHQRVRMFLVSRKHKESNLESVPVIVIDADGNEHDGVYKETDEGELWVEVNGAYFFVLPRSKRFINGGKYVSWRFIE